MAGQNLRVLRDRRDLGGDWIRLEQSDVVKDVFLRRRERIFAGQAFLHALLDDRPILAARRQTIGRVAHVNPLDGLGDKRRGFVHAPEAFEWKRPELRLIDQDVACVDVPSLTSAGQTWAL